MASYNFSLQKMILKFARPPFQLSHTMGTAPRKMTMQPPYNI